VNTRDNRPENEDASSNLPFSATGLFFPSMEPRPQNSAGSDEVSQLLEKPGAGNRALTPQTPDSADLSAEKIPQGNASPGENLPPPTAEPVSTVTRTADLTGIFRKVPSEQLEDLPPSSGRNSGNGEPGLASSGDAQETVELAAGFTQIFQSLSRSSGMRPREEKKGSNLGEPARRDSWQRQSSEGNISPAGSELHHPQTLREGAFTRLSENLNHEAPGTPGSEQSLTWSGAAPVSQKGGFTQLLRRLSAEEEEAAPLAEKQPVTLHYAPGESVSSGPGEFTRVISGSLLREAQGRTSPAASARTPAAEIADSTSAVHPSDSPEMPPPRLAPVQILTPEQLLTPPPAVRAVPISPVVPAALPAPQIQPEPRGNLQRYVPLLLMANLFVMVLILIAVVVVLSHR
jgi:hypothetical protein